MSTSEESTTEPTSSEEEVTSSSEASEKKVSESGNTSNRETTEDDRHYQEKSSVTEESSNFEDEGDGSSSTLEAFSDSDEEVGLEDEHLLDKQDSAKSRFFNNWFIYYFYRCRCNTTKTKRNKPMKPLYPRWFRHLYNFALYLENCWCTTCALGCGVPSLSLLLSIGLGIPAIIIAGLEWDDQDQCGDDRELALWLLVAGMIHLYTGLFPVARALFYAVEFLPVMDLDQPAEEDDEELEGGVSEMSLPRGELYIDCFAVICSIWNIAWYLVGVVWYFDRDDDCPDTLETTVLIYIIIYFVRLLLISPFCTLGWSICAFSCSLFSIENIIRCCPSCLRWVRHVVEDWVMCKCCPSRTKVWETTMWCVKFQYIVWLVKRCCSSDEEDEMEDVTRNQWC